ncbi:hypothetical protein ANCCAN_21158 [Ancylostoma caninum]|uniref:Uncharacterized protein n=1 Tax=Ancylostoma caninum TaxID=29170 RepID=A0A368FPT4_ANCCA|nr:hypothetical protein ANCCAN_21158 [Ancylostoma caninum]
MNPNLNAKKFTFRNSHLFVEYMSNNTDTAVVPFGNNGGEASCWKYEDPLRYFNHSAKYLLLNTYCMQNARFFKDYLSEIREMLRFSEDLCEKAQQKLKSRKRFNSNNRHYVKTTCVHTRRGDFLANGRLTSFNETVDAAHQIFHRHYCRRHLQGSEHYLIFGDDQKFMEKLARRLEMVDGSRKKAPIRVSSLLTTHF